MRIFVIKDGSDGFARESGKAAVNRNISFIIRAASPPRLHIFNGNPRGRRRKALFRENRAHFRVNFAANYCKTRKNRLFDKRKNVVLVGIFGEHAALVLVKNGDFPRIFDNSDRKFPPEILHKAGILLFLLCAPFKPLKCAEEKIGAIFEKILDLPDANA